MSSEGSSTGNSSLLKSFAAGVGVAAAGAALAWAVSGALSPQKASASSPRSSNDSRATEAGGRRSLSSSNLSVDESRSPSAWSPVDAVMKLFEMANDMGSDVMKSPMAANTNRSSDESKSPSVAGNRPNPSSSRESVSPTIIYFKIPKSPSTAANKSPHPAANGKPGQTFAKVIPKSPSAAAKKSPQPAANGKAGQTFAKLRMSIADKLNSATYDCMICFEMISKPCPVVACKRCHVISHLRCLRHYLSTAVEEGHAPVCPTCREKLTPNLMYRCFCEKKINPKPVEGLTPHTCGSICGKKTSSGKSCELICHPGPCD